MRAVRSDRRGYRDALVAAGFWSAAVWLAVLIMPNYNQRVLAAAIFTVLAFSAAISFRAIANALYRRARART